MNRTCSIPFPLLPLHFAVRRGCPARHPVRSVGNSIIPGLLGFVCLLAQLMVGARGHANCNGLQCLPSPPSPPPPPSSSLSNLTSANNNLSSPSNISSGTQARLNSGQDGQPTVDQPSALPLTSELDVRPANNEQPFCKFIAKVLPCGLLVQVISCS